MNPQRLINPLCPIVFISDDAQVKQLALTHGHAAELAPEPGHAGAFRHHVIWRDADMWYCVRHYTGYTDPKDNGFVAMLIPRNVISDTDAAKIIEAYTHQGSTGPDIYSHGVRVNGNEN